MREIQKSRKWDLIARNYRLDARNKLVNFIARTKAFLKQLQLNPDNSKVCSSNDYNFNRIMSLFACLYAKNYVMCDLSFPLSKELIDCYLFAVQNSLRNEFGKVTWSMEFYTITDIHTAHIVIGWSLSSIGVQTHRWCHCAAGVICRTPNAECRTQNTERRTPNAKQNHRNKQKPLPLLRANRKQANLSDIQANWSAIQANRSVPCTQVSLKSTPVSLNIAQAQVSLFTVSSQ